MTNPILVPRRDRVVNQSGTVTKAWAEYFSALSETNAISSTTAGTVDLTGQSASIASTSIPIQTVYTAMYRVSYYAEITQAATVASSLTVTIGWVHSSKTFSQSGAAITGNTTTTQQNDVLTILVDGSSPLTYSTTYSSTGATAMEYALSITAELV